MGKCCTNVVWCSKPPGLRPQTEIIRQLRGARGCGEGGWSRAQRGVRASPSPARPALGRADGLNPKHLLGSIHQSFSSPLHPGLPAVRGGAAEVSLAVAFPAQALETCRISMTKRRRAQRHLQPPRCLPAASRPLRLPGPVLLALPAGWGITQCWEQLLEEGAPLVQHPEVLSWV